MDISAYLHLQEIFKEIKLVSKSKRDVVQNFIKTYADENTKIFPIDKFITYEEYKELMKKAINENLIDAKTKKKYWYLDYKEYHYVDDIGLGCYQDKDEYDIQIVSS